jgi:hypothetical protein
MSLSNYIYDTYGTRIIKDMLPTATKAREHEERIAQKRHELEALKDELDELRSPVA